MKDLFEPKNLLVTFIVGGLGALLIAAVLSFAGVDEQTLKSRIVSKFK